MKRFRVFLLVSVPVLAATVVLATSSIQIPRHVIAGGGGKLEAGSTRIRSTVGQPIVVRVQQSNTLIRSGYWQPQSGVSGIETEELPAHPELYGNSPNPFNPMTNISFNAGRKAIPVRLDVFDIQGHLVRTLVDEVVGPGLVTRTWNGRSDSGMAMATGLYLYRLQADGEVFTRKMLLMK